VAIRWGQIGHYKARTAEGDAFGVLDDAIRKGARGRPLVPEHWPENLFLRGVVAANHSIDARHGEHRHICPVEKCRDTSVMVGMTVGHDDRDEWFLQRPHTRAERFPVRHAQRRINDDDAFAGLDEIGVDRKKSGLEPMDGNVAICRHIKKIRTVRTWRKGQRSVKSCQKKAGPNSFPRRAVLNSGITGPSARRVRTLCPPSQRPKSHYQHSSAGDVRTLVRLRRRTLKIAAGTL
jgi:hypothetical protein